MKANLSRKSAKNPGHYHKLLSCTENRGTVHAKNIVCYQNEKKKKAKIACKIFSNRDW